LPFWFVIPKGPAFPALSIAADIMPKTLTDSQVALIAKALADPRRYDILKTITNSANATPCTRLLQTAEVAPATLSHHMKELETAGLVRSKKDGKFVHYKPQPHVLKAYLKHLRTELT
jgi:ArsR family transcriptional regulator